MKKLLIASVVAFAGVASAHAAQVTNKNDKPVVIVIVDGGNRMSVAIDAGSTETVCPSGCFMTTPDGDRIGLSGDEKVEIKGSSAFIK